MTKEITGVVPPIITTFDENGEFDPKRMKNLVKYVEKGVSKEFLYVELMVLVLS